MNRNKKRLVNIFFLAAAFVTAGCGGAAEQPGGKAAPAPQAANASSPASTANGGANAGEASAGTAPTVPASADAAAARPGASPASATRGGGGPSPKAMPTPQIGSGGNDFFLFTQARAALGADAELKGLSPVIEVKDGVVTLSGTAATPAQKSRAEEVARGVGGVKAVRNQLRVSAGK